MLILVVISIILQVWALDYDDDDHYNKTQRQLCKRLTGSFIPFSWSEKEFHFGFDH